MRNDAEAHAEDDKKKLAEIEARNILDNRVYQVEKLIADNREKLSESDIKPVEEAVATAKSALAGGILDQITSATHTLEQASHKLAEVLYQSAQASGAQAGAAGSAEGSSGAHGGPNSGQSSAPPPGEVIDAEYVDVDETKKPN
jgi:molecular chaperone DnaK